MGLRNAATTSAKSRNTPLAMKWVAMRWSPSSITKPPPVITCQSQLELALGSCTNGFSILSTSKDLQRRGSQHDDGHKHQDAEEGFLCLHACAKARKRHTQPIETVNERTGEQNDIESQEVNLTRQRHQRNPLACTAQQHAMYRTMHD